MAKPSWLQGWRFLGDNQTLSIMNIFKVNAINHQEARNINTYDDSSMVNYEPTTDDANAKPFLSNSASPDRAELVSMLQANLSAQELIYMIIVLSVTTFLIVTGALTIIVVATSASLKDVVGYYAMSLAVVDLLCGIIVTPIAIYAIVDGGWHLENNSFVCLFEIYAELVLLSVTLYLFMWISVDRFIAVTRPSRYEMEQTLHRCQFWVLFSWITSLLLCCPVLFGDMQMKFNKHTYLCTMNYSTMIPYVVTMVLLIVLPSVTSILYIYSTIFRRLRNVDNEVEDNYKAQLKNDKTIKMTFLVIVSTLLSWTPVLVIILIESNYECCARTGPLCFVAAWLALSSGCWKFLIYCSTSKVFRQRLRATFMPILNNFE